MNIDGAVVLITGANRGLGQSFARAMLDAGAAKVYGGARDPRTITDPDVIPVQLDITSADDVAGAAEQCSDVTILINNAGVATGTAPLGEGALEGARRDMETNYFGTLRMADA